MARLVFEFEKSKCSVTVRIIKDNRVYRCFAGTEESAKMCAREIRLWNFRVLR
jgi:hypothetical protein